MTEMDDCRVMNPDKKGTQIMSRKGFALLVLLILSLSVIGIPCCSAATTQIHVVKYANDRSTLLAEQTLTYQQMRDTLPVQGDGSTHYFHQGPVFIDDPDPAIEEQLRWNPDEDTNCMEKDMGAVRGTDVRDLCDLVGGMEAGDTLVLKASDGMTKEFAYENVYSPSSRQGALVITWYCTGIASCTGPYPDTGYSDGMRLVFFADESVNPWGEHVFGNFDWHESADPKYWYFYQSGGEDYPTTTGLSVKYISEVLIYSTKPAGSSSSSGRGGTLMLPVSGAPPPEDPDLYGYKGKSVGSFRSGTLNGTVSLVPVPVDTPVVVNNRVREFPVPVSLPHGVNLTLARLYLYVSGSYNLQFKKGVIPSFYATFDDTPLRQDQLYIDTEGDEHRQVAATYAYDVQELLKRNGTHTLSVRNLDHEQHVFSIDGILLVTAAQNETIPATTYWIDESCDVIESLPEKGLFPDDCETGFSFPGSVNASEIVSADLYLVSTGIDRCNTTDHSVTFNEGKWENLFDGNSSAFPARIPVLDYLNETGNSAKIRSSIHTHDADHLISRTAILIAEHAPADGNTSGNTVPQTVPDLPIGPADPDVLPLPPDEDRTCQISLDSDPGGALIYLDGRYLGKTTPYRIDLPEGARRTARFELDGYVPEEITFTATEGTCLRPSLYAPVRTPKGRLDAAPEDPDGIRYGGLFITSRPTGTMISIDGISTGKTTPAAIVGLEPGSHTIKLVRELRDTYIKDRNEFAFDEEEAWVLPGVTSLVEINGIGFNPHYQIIIDSRSYRGDPMTVNGKLFNQTVPAKVNIPRFHSFVTIRRNDAYVSYPVPYILSDERYLLLEPRDFQNLSIAVDSDPRGARVFIDGFDTGSSTPFTFANISDGMHRIMVTKEGYMPQQRLVELPRRALPIPLTTVSLALEEYPSGFLYVTSNPVGVDVAIDGISTGELTPALFRAVATGSHSVRVSTANTSKTISDVIVNPVVMTNVTADFAPPPEPQYCSSPLC